MDGAREAVKRLGAGPVACNRINQVPLGMIQVDLHCRNRVKLLFHHVTGNLGLVVGCDAARFQLSVMGTHERRKFFDFH